MQKEREKTIVRKYSRFIRNIHAQYGLSAASCTAEYGHGGQWQWAAQQRTSHAINAKPADEQSSNTHVDATATATGQQQYAVASVAQFAAYRQSKQQQ